MELFKIIMYTLHNSIFLHFYSKSAEFDCTKQAHHYSHSYLWTVSIPPVTRDIACFPISTINFSSETKNTTEVIDAITPKTSVVCTV